MKVFKEEIARVAADFFKNPPKKIILLHHNDTDGLTAGAILSLLFKRLNISFKRFSLEKPYPLVVEHILSKVCDQETTLFITDFGSGMLPELSKINSSRGFNIPIYVLDHHQVNSRTDPKISLLNGLTLGLTSTDFSSSALCYAFADSIDSGNSDLAWLGALGALGDQFLLKGKLAGLNDEAWRKAEELKLGVYNKEYCFNLDTLRPANTLVQVLDALGGVGYLRDGVEAAISGLTEGMNENFFLLASQYLAEMRQKFKEVSDKFSPKGTTNIQWFDLGASFFPMGVKCVGLLCSHLIAESKVDPLKYLAGFQRVPNTIPGLGSFELNQSKVSMRVPELLREKIEQGRAPDLTKILPKATTLVGGFVDACHPLAAATTVPLGSEEALITALQREIENFQVTL